MQVNFICDHFSRIYTKILNPEKVKSNESKKDHNALNEEMITKDRMRVERYVNMTICVCQRCDTADIRRRR